MGFDVPSSKLRKVKYVGERLARSTLELPDKDEKLLTTKFNHWSYEQEHRMILNLRNFTANTSNLRFKSFDDDLMLREVYIGCRSSLDFAQVRAAVTSSDKEVVVKHTRPSFRDFRIVWDQKKRSVRT
ncbi:MAG: hypothetical protein H6993_06500 [Pseudomonadales bacterium]|nr:hypothetical protein [Pseudomonadales bacterium]